MSLPPIPKSPADIKVDDQNIENFIDGVVLLRETLGTNYCEWLSALRIIVRNEERQAAAEGFTLMLTELKTEEKIH